MLKTLITRYWLLLPLLIFAVVLIDRIEQPSTVQIEETINMSETQSDYYLSDFRTTRFGLDGKIEYIVAGETLAHYPIDNHSRISAPRVELRRENVLWIVESVSGRYDPAPSLFTFQGQVSIKRTLPDINENTLNLNDLQSSTVVMTTESLRISTESNLVETDDLVDITAPTWRLQSRGLRTAIDEGQLSLLADVVGRYEVPAREQ